MLFQIHRPGVPLLSLASALLLLACTAAAAETPTESSSPNHSFLDPVGDFARDTIIHPKTPFELVPGKDPNGWGFAIEPYGWAMGLSGTTGVSGLPPVHLDVSSKKILQQLDWAVMGMAEIRKGRWGLLADGYYAELTSAGDLEGHLYKSGAINVAQGLASLALAYRVIDDRRGFLDLYAGARYNYLGIDASANTDSAGIEDLSTGITNRVAQVIDQQVSAAVQSIRAQVVSAVQVTKQSIDATVAADAKSIPYRVTEDVRSRVQPRVLETVAQDVRTRLEGRLLRDLRDRGLGQEGLSDRSNRGLRRAGLDPRRVEHLQSYYSDLRTIEDVQSVRNGRPQQRTRGALVEYVRASVDLEIAKVRGEATADLEKRASVAKAKASKELAADIEEALPTNGSGDQWWIDPIIGLRGQVNFTRWLYLTAQADVGGFGVGSQITWNVLAALGVNFTRNTFAELGYRYMYIDYSNDGALYNMNTFGIFTSIGVKF